MSRKKSSSFRVDENLTEAELMEYLETRETEENLAPTLDAAEQNVDPEVPFVENSELTRSINDTLVIASSRQSSSSEDRTTYTIPLINENVLQAA